MTITNTARSISYPGDGVALNFPFSFPIPEGTEKVYLREAGVDTLLVRGTDYSVEGYGQDAGGSITILDTAPTALQTVIIMRDVPPTQEYDFTNQTRYYGASVEDALDRMTMVVQQLKELVERCYRAPIEGTTTDFEFESGSISTAATNAAVAEAAAATASAAASLAVAAQENLFEAWQGAWLTATAYEAGDLARVDGTTYLCLLDHTSGTFATDLSAGRWEVFAQQGAAGAGTGDMLAANNLSDVADPATSRSNLGLGGLATLSEVDLGQLSAGLVVTEAEGIGANDNDTTLPTSAAVKNYVDSAVAGVSVNFNVGISGMSYGSRGTYVFAATVNNANSVNPGATIAGSQLQAAGVNHGSTEAAVLTTGSALSGTWRAMGLKPPRNSSGSSERREATLFLRVS